jgi:hypothetical protein
MDRRIEYESWLAVNDRGTLVENERKRMSVPWRIWELALYRANNWGHAGFRPGELPRLACGDDSRASRQTVYRGMRILADMGRIMPVTERGSTQLCIVINSKIAQRRAGKGRRLNMCSEPEHMDYRETTWPPEAIGHTEGLPGPHCPGCKALMMLGTHALSEIGDIHRASLRPSRPTDTQNL